MTEWIICRAGGNDHQRQVARAVCKARAEKVYDPKYEAAYRHCLECLGIKRLGDEDLLTQVLTSGDVTSALYDTAMQNLARIGAMYGVNPFGQTKEALIDLIEEKIDAGVEPVFKEAGISTPKPKNGHTRGTPAPGARPRYTYKEDTMGEFTVTFTGKGVLKDAGKHGYEAASLGSGKVSASIKCATLAELPSLTMPELVTVETMAIEPGFDHSKALMERTSRELNLLGINAQGSEAGVGAAFTGVSVGELGNAALFMILLHERGKRKVVVSDHQMTWFDTKQAAGLIHRVKTGDKVAKKITEWADTRINEVKAVQAEALVSAAPPKAPKAPKPKAQAKAPAKKSAKKSAVAKTASLIPGGD